VPPGTEFAWEAFCALSGDRVWLMAGFAVPMGATIIEPRPGPIPFSAIDRYARRYDISGSAFDLLVRLVALIDLEYRAIDAEQAKERAARRN
jgi:hypothetical protein